LIEFAPARQLNRYAPMTKELAAKIAALINERNQLDGRYDTARILKHSGNYEYELDGDVLIACVEIKDVQWYQWEICHLSVNSAHGRKGHGSRMIQRAEEKAKQGGARIVQCTIRVGNVESEGAFRKHGYTQATCFYNERTKNYVGVWQKVICHHPPNPAGGA
jgi:RimJ/RimL family protein N-acetyltransferase